MSATITSTTKFPISNKSLSSNESKLEEKRHKVNDLFHKCLNFVNAISWRSFPVFYLFDVSQETQIQAILSFAGFSETIEGNKEKNASVINYLKNICTHSYKMKSELNDSNHWSFTIASEAEAMSFLVTLQKEKQTIALMEIKANTDYGVKIDEKETAFSIFKMGEKIVSTEQGDFKEEEEVEIAKIKMESIQKQDLEKLSLKIEEEQFLVLDEGKSFLTIQRGKIEKKGEEKTVFYTKKRGYYREDQTECTSPKKNNLVICEEELHYEDSFIEAYKKTKELAEEQNLPFHPRFYPGKEADFPVMCWEKSL